MPFPASLPQPAPVSAVAHHGNAAGARACITVVLPFARCSNINGKKRNINLVLEPNLMGSMADCTWHERKKQKSTDELTPLMDLWRKNVARSREGNKNELNFMGIRCGFWREHRKEEERLRTWGLKGEQDEDASCGLQKERGDKMEVVGLEISSVVGGLGCLAT